MNTGAGVRNRLGFFRMRLGARAYQGRFACGGGLVRGSGARGGGSGGLGDDDGGAMAAGERGCVGVVDAVAGF